MFYIVLRHFCYNIDNDVIFQEKKGVRKLKQYTGIQYSTTGAFGYSFRDSDTEQFNISYLILPDLDIILSGFHKKLRHRNFDGQITLCPGVRRNIVDESGNVQGYYEYAEINEFHIMTEGTAARAKVKASEVGWQVFIGADLIAEILRLPECERKRFEENGFDMELQFQVNISEKTTPSLYPYIMAVPILGF